MEEKTEAIDHLGNVFTSKEEMLKAYGVNKNVYTGRLNRGWTKESALTTPTKEIQRGIRDHLGNEYSSVQKMCAQYPVGTAYSYNNRIKMGWSVEKALMTPVDKLQSATDHLGNQYRSVKNMCESYPVKNDKTFRLRIKNGWTLEDALMTPEQKTKVVDHLGNEYDSLKDMCAAYPVKTSSAYHLRKNKGWDLEKILTTPLKSHAVTDHLGNEYPSLEAMCIAYPVRDANAYRKRIKAGLTKEKALMTAPGKDTTITDHLGNTFASLTEMCAAYPVQSAPLYHSRINRGMSLQEALTEPVNHKGSTSGKASTDHLGNTYSSQKEMCNAYGISDNLFARRRLRGWTLEAALTTPAHGTLWKSVKDENGNEYKNTMDACVDKGMTRGCLKRRIDDNDNIHDLSYQKYMKVNEDGEGNVFQTKAEMCEYYNIPYREFYRRVHKDGMDVQTALTTPYDGPKFKQAETRIGEKHTANNGCELTIIAVDSVKKVTVEFEDGSTSVTAYTNIKNGVVKHPTLKPKGIGSFAGFTTKNDHVDESGVYYKCQCQTCGITGVMKPKEMLEHQKSHQ